MVNFEIKNFGFAYAYADTEKPVLKNIDFKIEQGEFVVVCGKSGSGKSTLLRMLKPELSPRGKKNGEIFYFGKAENEFSLRESAEKTGFLLQNPEYQAVTHTVRSELAFGLENLGLDSRTIRRRVAETAAYFSLDKIIDRKIAELSGGEKQLVCLAAAVALHPKALILDEPTSQLDPVAASEFLCAVEKLCRENGITVILSEHRLENILPAAHRVIILENGEIIADCPPCDIGRNLITQNDFVGCAVPVSMRIFSELGLDGKMPVGIADGHKMLENLLGVNIKHTVPERETEELSDGIAVRMKSVWHAYPDSGYVLKNMNFSVKSSSFTAIMGANGAGKTTALSIMSGITECKSGKIEIFGKNIKKYKDSELYNGIIGVLPQKCETLFAGNTVREDLQNVLYGCGLKKDEIKQKIDEIAEFTEIEDLLERHPYDISGGEMQRAALALVLLKKPKILFLDEPTKGTDNLFKAKFAQKIKELCKNGVTVIAVSHDTEFCALYCDECALFSDGTCVAHANKYDFFADNYFYTTAAAKISRDIFENAVTQRQVLELCKKNL